MKVIRAERLREVANILDDGMLVKSLLESLIAECKEIDTLTVSSLRPMAEKPIIPEGKLQIFVMVYLNYTDVPVIISYDTREKWPDEAYHGVGWVYLPLHKPEKE